jgi:hypothetical protein
MEEIGLREFDEMRAFPELQLAMASKTVYPEFCARGKVEFRDNFYGCDRVGSMWLMPPTCTHRPPWSSNDSF